MVSCIGQVMAETSASTTSVSLMPTMRMMMYPTTAVSILSGCFLPGSSAVDLGAEEPFANVSDIMNFN